ncbi:MAG: hypothetical protein ACTSVB_07860 [Candidatus Heimdallarchaeaceae archaeon]
MSKSTTTEQSQDLRYFKDGVELQLWLDQDNISDRNSSDAVIWYASALELQKRAIKDGYIINAYIFEDTENPEYFTVYCDAVTEDNSLYWWDPETDEVYYEMNIKYF